MAYIGEIGMSQLIKHGEVTCGDAAEVIRNADNVVVVLSDGLGSGVKANILSHLTTKIAAKMISSDISIEDVVETLAETLPTCSVRGLAYSTFSILRIYDDGIVHLMDFDGCPVVRIHKGVIKVIKTVSLEIAGRRINEAFFRLEEDDLLLVVSDGVIEAGLGLTLPMGLGINGLVDAIKKHVKSIRNAQDLANQVIEICQSYYLSEPGDDTTAVAVRLKQAKRLVVLTGTPPDWSNDAAMVERFLAESGTKVICGGTTAHVFARETQREIQCSFAYVDEKIPPISQIKGVDLVTEGIVTMTEALNYFDRRASRSEGKDGASLLLNQFLESDDILFLVGTQINPAYKDNSLPITFDLREAIIEKWRLRLEALGKRVTIEKW